MTDRIYGWAGTGPTDFNGNVTVDGGSLTTTGGISSSGDLTLSDSGTYTTTLQCITPTAARTISLPDATGTVGLVGGSSGQIVYNNAGAYAGVSTMTFDGTNVTLAGRLINTYTSVASSPANVFTGTWFTGGTATTTKPHFLIEPTGTTSTAWSTSGTGLGVNAASGFAGNLLDLQVNGSTIVSVNGSTRRLNLGSSVYFSWDTDGYTPTITNRYGVSYVFRDRLEIPNNSFMSGGSISNRYYVQSSRSSITPTLNTAVTPAETGWIVGKYGGAYAASTGYHNGSGQAIWCGYGAQPTDTNANGGTAGDFDVWLNSGGAGKGTGVAGENGRLRIIDDDTDKPTFTVEKLGTTSVYNAFTSYSNYERGRIAWSSNVFIIGTEKGSGGGTARALELQTDGTTRLTVAATGGTITAASGTALVADLRSTGTAPASATATGTAGDIRYDADYIYICTATNTWKRAALSTW